MAVRGFGVELVTVVVAVILVLVLVGVMVLWVSVLGSYGSSRRQGVFEVEAWG